MTLLLRRWFLKATLVISCFLLVCAPVPTSAQHPTAHPAGGAVHAPAPPVAHAPLSSSPTIHAPIISVPFTAPRTWAASSAAARFRPPRRPIRPFPPVWVLYQSPFLVGGLFWGFNSCWWAECDLFWPWTLGYSTVSSPGPVDYVPQVNETPEYVYGEERPDLPQLFLKDGSILSVTDYWLVDDQLHFTMVEAEGSKPVEHVVPFDTLDWETTVDANTRRGFRVMLRNEPFEQYVRDHPDGPPPVVTPPHQ